MLAFAGHICKTGWCFWTYSPMINDKGYIRAGWYPETLEQEALVA